MQQDSAPNHSANYGKIKEYLWNHKLECFQFVLRIACVFHAFRFMFMFGYPIERRKFYRRSLRMAGAVSLIRLKVRFLVSIEKSCYKPTIARITSSSRRNFGLYGIV
ncbi:hypothetical protein ACOME3_001082 [Neoechinorhynchus agilis]